MKVTTFPAGTDTYSCNVYYLSGSWNTLEDVNTLVDVGRDPRLLEVLESFPSGVGQRKLHQIVLTHSHYDHSELLPKIIDRYEPRVYAFDPSVKGVTNVLQPGQNLKMGDRHVEVLHIPGHSSDSACFLCEEEGLLFSGDTPLVLNAPGTYGKPYIEQLERLTRSNVTIIYPGHGSAISDQCIEKLKTSLALVVANEG